MPLIYFHVMASKEEKAALGKIRATKLSSEGEVRETDMKYTSKGMQRPEQADSGLKTRM